LLWRRLVTTDNGVHPMALQFKIELSARRFHGNLCRPMQQVHLGMIGIVFLGIVETLEAPLRAKSSMITRCSGTRNGTTFWSPSDPFVISQ